MSTLTDAGLRFARRVGRALPAAVRRPLARALRRAAAVERPFCSVIVRTQGSRTSLVDTLTTLAAQTDRDLEVLLMVHSDERAAVERVRTLAASFEPDMAARIRVHEVRGSGRSAPLNAALDVATGRYVAVVDDDDVVTSDWLAAFRRAAERGPGKVVRSACVVQWVERRDGGRAEFEPVTGFEAMYPDRFDFLDHVRNNRSPSCSYAVPMDAVRRHGLRYDETLRVCEDWKFQLQAVRIAGVSDDPAVTSVYRRWRGDGGSEAAEDRQVWIDDHLRVVDDLDTEPTVVPPGSLRRIHDLYQRVEQLEIELGRRRPDDGPLGHV